MGLNVASGGLSWSAPLFDIRSIVAGSSATKFRTRTNEAIDALIFEKVIFLRAGRERRSVTLLGRKIVSSAVWTAGASWGSQLVTLTVFVILARYLGPDDFGIATLAMLPPLFLSVLVITGIPDALVQRREVTATHLDSAFWFLAGAGLMLSALIWAFAGPIAGAFGQPSLKEVVRWTSIIVAIQALAAVPTVVLKRELDFRVLAVSTLVATALSAALGIGHGDRRIWRVEPCLDPDREGGDRDGAGVLGKRVAALTCATRMHVVGSCLVSRARSLRNRLLAMANDELPSVALGIFLGPGAVGVYAFARRPFQILWDVFLNRSWVWSCRQSQGFRMTRRGSTVSLTPQCA